MLIRVVRMILGNFIFYIILCYWKLDGLNNFLIMLEGDNCIELNLIFVMMLMIMIVIRMMNMIVVRWCFWWLLFDVVFVVDVSVFVLVGIVMV